MKNSSLQQNHSLDAGDCLIFSTPGLQPGSHALRCMKEYELTLLPAGFQVKLAIGDMAVVLSGLQLVLVAPGVPHSWSLVEEPAFASAPTERDPGVPRSPLVLRWPGDLLGDRFLGKKQLQPIGILLQNALRGVVFSPETTVSAEALLAGLKKKSGFESVYGLLSLLHHLSVSAGSRPVADKIYTCPGSSAGDSRINSAVAYMKANYSQAITLGDVARKARMTKGAFCRSIRKRTGKTYAESLSEIRIDHICNRLLNSSDTVSEIAYQAGYNNVTHFHRCFKRLKGCTPKEFRENAAG